MLVVQVMLIEPDEMTLLQAFPFDHADERVCRDETVPGMKIGQHHENEACPALPFLKGNMLHSSGTVKSIDEQFDFTLFF